MNKWDDWPLHQFDEFWLREFPESSEAPIFRTTYPFLSQFRLVLIVFKRDGRFEYIPDVHLIDYHEGEVLIRVERLRKPRSSVPPIDSKKNDEKDGLIKSRAENFRNYKTRKDRISYINVEPSMNALKRFIKSEDPKDIFNYMDKLLQEVVDSGHNFPQVLREWESELFERNPTPYYGEKLRLARGGKVDISSEEFETFKKVEGEYHTFESCIEDPILPALLTFVAGFEPEHMRTYFDYVDQIAEWKREEGKFLNFKVEFRWFVRNYIRCFNKIGCVDCWQSIDLQYLKSEPVKKMLMERAAAVNNGYNEFCVQVANSTYLRYINQGNYKEIIKERFPISWYRELFNDTFEEYWFERFSFDLQYKFRNFNYNCLPLHVLEKHPFFAELTDFWDISLSDLKSLAEICKIVKIPCYDLSRPNCWQEFSNNFFAVFHEGGEITALSLNSSKLTVEQILHKFPKINYLVLCLENVIKERDFSKSEPKFISENPQLGL